MTMFTFREATVNDIPFLVDTIIEAEKSGTDILTYTTIFGLPENETRKYMTQMLMEEVDGCELSVSSFLLAEKDEQIAASVGAWIEGFEGVPSNILKGNLLSFTLPEWCMARARDLSSIVSDMNIDYVPDAIQIGLVYVASGFRGMNLVQLLIDEQVKRLRQKEPTISDIYVQVYGNNSPAIRAYEKANFEIVKVKESLDKDVLNYMPSDKKILMKRKM